MNVQDQVIECMRIKGRPTTAVEIMTMIYPDLPDYKRTSKRTKIYGILRNFEKYGIVKKGAMLDRERLWVLA